MSTENATILTNTDRWPLMIDPQVSTIELIIYCFTYSYSTVKQRTFRLKPNFLYVLFYKVPRIRTSEKITPYILNLHNPVLDNKETAHYYKLCKSSHKLNRIQ